MKHLTQQILTLILLSYFVISCSNSQQIEPDLTLKVSKNEYSETPISPLLYSHFIEIGFGYQIAPMQAELLFNRSFENFPPYNGRSKNSFGFLLPDNKYISDWSGESWYHSGYEHNSWYAAPGKPDEPWIITDESTFFKLNTKDIKVKLELNNSISIHGERSIRIQNKENEHWGGIAQDGKRMVNGKKYFFTGYLKLIKDLIGSGPSSGVELRIYQEGMWDEPVVTHKINITDEFAKYTVEIPYDGPTEQMTFALFIPPLSEVDIDAFSLLPEDHFYKWKAETVETVKKLNPGLIRFPGGCFASFYDWKQGVGPYDLRVPEPSYFWGGLNNNDLGTAEFAMLCNKVGCEMMLCINMYHPWKKEYLLDSRNPWQDNSYVLPQFSDIEKGIKDAVDWLAYCNLKSGTHPMADLRAEHGFEAPFEVKYWEMDNETVRWMSAEEYAELVVRYSKAMKALDPTIKIGMVTYDFTDKVPAMLEIAGKHIDFFADRDDYEDGRLDMMIGLLENYNQKNNTAIKYCNTEWQVHPYGAKNPKDEVDEQFLYGHKTEIKRSMVLGTWYCGLKAAGYLMDWQRKGSIVDFVNYNNFSNTHGQAVLETPKEGAYLTAPGKLYELISRTPAKWPLKIEEYKANRTDMLQVQVAFSAERDSLVLYALNRTDSIKYLDINLSALDIKYKKVSYSMLEADDIFARTKIDKPNEIRRKDWEAKYRGKSLFLECPPRSFTQAILH